MKHTNNENQQNPLKHNRTKILLFVGIVLVLVSPWLLTREAIYNWFDFSDTGQIGDTIGGITAPVVNLIGALLVYMSFREQMRANQLQREALDTEMSFLREQATYETLNKNYSEIRSEITNLHVSVQIKTENHAFDTEPFSFEDRDYEGFAAINAYSESKTNKSMGIRNYKDINNGIFFVVILLHSFLDSLRKSKINHEFKSDLWLKLNFLYYANLYDTFDTIKNNEDENNITSMKPLSKAIKDFQEELAGFEKEMAVTQN